MEIKKTNTTNWGKVDSTPNKIDTPQEVLEYLTQDTFTKSAVMVCTTGMIGMGAMNAEMSVERDGTEVLKQMITPNPDAPGSALIKGNLLDQKIEGTITADINSESYHVEEKIGDTEVVMDIKDNFISGKAGDIKFKETSTEPDKDGLSYKEGEIENILTKEKTNYKFSVKTAKDDVIFTEGLLNDQPFSQKVKPSETPNEGDMPSYKIELEAQIAKENFRQKVSLTPSPIISPES